MKDQTHIYPVAQLAVAALLLIDFDYGSEGQHTMFNMFCSKVEALLPPDVFDDYSDWCLKATEREIVMRGLELVRDFAPFALPLRDASVPQRLAPVLTSFPRPGMHS